MSSKLWGLLARSNWSATLCVPVPEKANISHCPVFGLSPDRPAAARLLTALFLAIGAGAVFAVADAIGTLIRSDMAKCSMPLTICVGVMAGMLMLVTGVLIT